MTNREIPGIGVVGLWKIDEPEHWFVDQLHPGPKEQHVLQAIRGSRRTEWLAGRLLAHHLSGHPVRLPCLNMPSGKPFFVGSDQELSLSHSYGIVAAFVSPSHSIGVDVQKVVSKINRIAPRFLNQNELDCLDSHLSTAHLHVFWGAKESIYKADDRSGLDLRKHIHINPFSYNPKGGSIQGSVTRIDPMRRFDLQYELLETHMLVFGFESTQTSTR